jgi:transketolase
MSLKPLNIKSKLLPAPTSAPKYGISIKDAKQNEIKMANPKATRSLIALMDMSAVNGGAACHWGGPSAMTEAWTALHAIMFKEKNWFDSYNFVNDIGHAENGIYALRAVLGYGDLTLETLKGFRSMGSKLTGHGESHLYPEGVLLSNGPLGSALPSLKDWPWRINSQAIVVSLWRVFLMERQWKAKLKKRLPRLLVSPTKEN